MAASEPEVGHAVAGGSRPFRAVRQSIAREALDGAFLDELWGFISGYVTRSREAFERALPGYAFISVWRDRATGEMLGFAANKLMPLRVHDREVHVIYSGWAILSPRARGRNFIQAEGLRCTLHAKLWRPLTPAFWVFGASTYKSYLLLPRNFVRYFPRRDAAWPPFEREIRDRVMAEMADPNWDPEAGVIRRHGVSRYLEGVIQDAPDVQADPDVAFYARSNPNQHEGDTLLVVAPLSTSNWLSLISRSTSRALRRRKRPTETPR